MTPPTDGVVCLISSTVYTSACIILYMSVCPEATLSSNTSLYGLAMETNGFQFI
jgi:hypothetical protein